MTDDKPTRTLAEHKARVARDTKALRIQVAAQCNAVVHLATALAKVHSDYAKMFARPDTGPDEILDIVGARTADFMEDLGNMLNDMDCVDPEDEFLEPIFKEAQRLWPNEE